MRTKKIALALLALGAWLAPASEANAAPEAPAWQLSSTPLPTNFAPSSERDDLLLVATNVGAVPTSGTITLSTTLPVGLTPTFASGKVEDPGSSAQPSCGVAGQTVTCADADPIRPGRRMEVIIVATVTASEGAVLTGQATISGGTAADVSTGVTIAISSTPAPFGFLAGFSGFNAPLGGPDGAAATAAGSHPYQLTVNLGFPTEEPAGHLGGAGHLRDVATDLPAGMIVDPTATSVLCTEAELITEGTPGCPAASQVGTAGLLTITGGPQIYVSPLYNMVPPPGAPAEFGFDAVGVGIFPHIIGGVRSDGDYGLSGSSDDILGLTFHPVFGVQLSFWGDPAGASHDALRGNCAVGPAQTCPLSPGEATHTAFLTMPGQCTGQPITTVARADDWEEPGLFHERSYQSADLAGNPVSISGCNALEFQPTISAQPTTNLIDSPSGLDVDLHQPQNTELGENDAGRSPAELRDASVTLPAGISVNPSQADGLGACSSAQIGLTTEIGATPVHFSKDPATCPDAAKLGTVEVTTPLLAEYEKEGTKLVTDPETGAAIPRPLHGSVYLAAPFDNPFHSLLAIYLAVEDPQSGTIAKLAGRIEPDPVTGQLTTTFAENPQLPIEDVRLHLFPGARASLISPPTCGAHTTTTDLTPWSAPEGADAHPESSFQTTAAPGGGACPTSAAQLPNAPAFTAGTISPQAGAYSPFALKLSREDGSQRLAAIDTTLPRGLIGKLAGIPYCSEAQIAQAQSRSHPNEGILERQSPSCPAATEVGTVDVAAGAGPTPFHAQGKAYLAGPYKAAPLSLAIITPAIAGPFDLGTVVVRTALYVDPETAQIHAVSDPLPTILDGIPLDVRSVAIRMDRPSFTLNPTSCDPMTILGTATSTLGQSAALSNPFQVGGCSALKFKPKLALSLKGATKRAKNPALKAVLTYPKGNYANIASAQVTLPHSEFLDQAHIGTVCTRVQFAARACPAASIYGHATAVTPLLEQPLSGPVYLRSSNNPLPDLVADLNGQIEVTLDGKVDTGKGGGIRNTFQAVPDAPVSRFVLEMQGGKKGLLVNSENLCSPKAKTHAIVNLTAQNGKIDDTTPKVQNSCKTKKSRKHKGHKHKGAHK